MNSSIVSQEQVYKITEVVELMKDNIIFYSIDNRGRKVIYVLKNKKIIVQSNAYKLSLDKDEFISLYKNEEFYLFEEENEAFVDEEKDKEYYSWEHK
ncbi:MAG: hypothetical protein SOV57_05395 [Bacilli bacterium]|nr:hypothetical protein [Erysipelotrichaceae bacterium]MDY2746620.1 hypothetical protein [Bacilli bacterium]MDY6142462.1 hypothetical protein [Bacilli bacterium]